MGGVVLAGGVVLGEKLLGNSGGSAPTIPSLGGTTQGINQATTQGTVTGTQSSSSSNAPAGYVFVATLSQVSGNAATFNHPTGGLCILVNYSGSWRAFSDICTHAGCQLSYTGSSLYCGCHNGNFSPTNGSPTGGPPTVPVAEYGVQIVNSNIYVSNNRIN